jgi:hypothetical protein
MDSSFFQTIERPGPYFLLRPSECWFEILDDMGRSIAHDVPPVLQTSPDEMKSFCISGPSLLSNRMRICWNNLHQPGILASIQFSRWTSAERIKELVWFPVKLKLASRKSPMKWNIPS